MPASKDILRYTERWMDLFDKFQEDPTKEHVVACVSEKQAKLMRLEFYKARRALELSEAELKKNDPKAYQQMGHPNLDRKEVRVVGNCVIFGFKDSSEIAKLIAASFEDPRNQQNGEQHGN